LWFKFVYQPNSNMEDTLYTGQAITCGAWPIVLNMQWTNAIVDAFELVHIPRAPNWLIGAVNIDGSIIPVVDLSLYFEPSATPMAIDKHHRILVGGKREDTPEASASNDNVFAILFSGLPMQTQYTREAMDASIVIPERLRELCLGAARDTASQNHFEMNTDRFVDLLSMSLI
jgi:chemotaxis signal transduction protein